MSYVLVIYASHYGQTRGIAERIAERLQHRGHEVELRNALEGAPRADSFDAVILGSRVELGKHAKVIEEYIRDNREMLHKVPTAFFSVSMSAAGKPAGSDPNGYLEKTFTSLGWAPSEAAAFGGSLQYRRYNWLTRMVMKAISKRGGHSTDTSKNHYYTDINAVVDFADRFAWHLGERLSVAHA